MVKLGERRNEIEIGNDRENTAAEAVVFVWSEDYNPFDLNCKMFVLAELEILDTHKPRPYLRHNCKVHMV